MVGDAVGSGDDFDDGRPRRHWAMFFDLFDRILAEHLGSYLRYAAGKSENL